MHLTVTCSGVRHRSQIWKKRGALPMQSMLNFQANRWRTTAHHLSTGKQTWVIKKSLSFRGNWASWVTVSSSSLWLASIHSTMPCSSWLLITRITAWQLTPRSKRMNFAMAKNGFTAHKHQREVGTGYFDKIGSAIAGGVTSTGALKGSTEEEQFSQRPVYRHSKLWLESNVSLMRFPTQDLQYFHCSIEHCANFLIKDGYCYSHQHEKIIPWKWPCF